MLPQQLKHHQPRWTAAAYGAGRIGRGNPCWKTPGHIASKRKLRAHCKHKDELASDLEHSGYIRETCGRDGTIMEIMSWRIREKEYLEKAEARRKRDGRAKDQRQVRVEIHVHECDIFLEQMSKLKIDDRIDEDKFGYCVDFPAQLEAQRKRCQRARRDAAAVEEKRQRKAAAAKAEKERIRKAAEASRKYNAEMRLKRMEMQRKAHAQMMAEREKQLLEQLRRRLQEEKERKAKHEQERRAKEERERLLHEEQMRREADEARRREERFRLERETAARMQAEVAEHHQQQLALYDSKWHALKTRDDLPPIDGSLLPWPVLDITVTCVDHITYERVKDFIFHPLRPGMERKSRRDRLKMDLLKWHPDKFTKVIGKVYETHRDYALEVAGVVVRILNQMKAEELENGL